MTMDENTAGAAPMPSSPGTGQVKVIRGYAVGYYVTVTDVRRRSGPLLGPYASNEAALAHVERAGRYVQDQYRNQGAEWWAFGTARLVMRPGHALPAGLLNDVLGLESAPVPAA